MLSEYLRPRRLMMPADAAPATVPPKPETEEVKPAPTEEQTPPTEEAPPAEEEPKSGKDDPLLAALGYGEVEVKPAPEDEVKPPAETKPDEPKPAEAKPPTPPPPPPTPTPEAKRTVRKSILPEDEPAAPSPALTAELPPATSPAKLPDAAGEDAEFISKLNEDQRDELAEAEYAAKLNPAKYGNRRKQLLDFYRRFEATSQKLMAENGDAAAVAESDEYKRVIASKPVMDAADQRRVLRSMGADEGAKKAKSELDPEMESIKRGQEEIVVAPKLATVGSNFIKATEEILVADEKSPVAPMMKAYREKGFVEAAKEFPLEAEIISAEVTRGGGMAKEFVRLVHMAQKGHSVFDSANKTHQEIVEFIEREGRAFAQHGGDMRSREGRQFLPRSEYAEKLKTNRDTSKTHWTFSDQDILGMIAEDTKTRVESRLAAELESASKRGFVRAKPAAAAETRKPEPTPITPPKAIARPAKGATEAPAANGNEISVKQTLGY